MCAQTRGHRREPPTRFVLVPALREELEVLVPEDHDPGRPWKPGLPVEAASAAAATKPIRIGYARCSTAQEDDHSGPGE